jgi:DNA polymerase III alpha subunit
VADSVIFSIADAVPGIEEVIKDFSSKVRELKVNKSQLYSLVRIGFFGDIYKNLNHYYDWIIEQTKSEKTGYISQKNLDLINEEREEDLKISAENHTNNALGMAWFNKLDAIYEKLEEHQKDKDTYIVIEITELKKGTAKTGRDWYMCKGETVDGKVTAFFDSSPGVLSKGDIILSTYKKGKSDAISLLNWKLLA